MKTESLPFRKQPPTRPASTFSDLTNMANVQIYSQELVRGDEPALHEFHYPTYAQKFPSYFISSSATRLKSSSPVETLSCLTVSGLFPGILRERSPRTRAALLRQDARSKDPACEGRKHNIRLGEDVIHLGRRFAYHLGTITRQTMVGGFMRLRSDVSSQPPPNPPPVTQHYSLLVTLAT